MNFEGIIFSFTAIFIMGIYHPIVIKAEYYFSQKIWPVFCVIGIICIAASLRLEGFVSYLIAFLGATNLWCIIEVKQQEKRVQKGWFPANPNRKIGS